MNVLRVLGFLAFVLIAGGWFYWEKTRPEIPVQRTLVSEDGKTLDVLIVGKVGQILHIERTVDRARFEMPLAKLGWEDRFFAERLRDQEPPPVVVVVEEKPEEPYVASRRLRLAELEKKRVEYTAEIKSGSLTEMLARKRKEDLFEIGKEIKELKAAIQIHSARSE